MQNLYFLLDSLAFWNKFFKHLNLFWHIILTQIFKKHLFEAHLAETWTFLPYAVLQVPCTLWVQ